MKYLVLKNNIYYKLIYELFISLEPKPEVIYNKYAITLKFKAKNKINILICFWLDKDRISFFIKDFEIIDEYIKSKNQSKEIFHFLKNLLSNDVTLTEYTTSNNVLYKRVLNYWGFVEGSLKNISDIQNLKIKFPWIYLNKKVKKFAPWR